MSFVAELGEALIGFDAHNKLISSNCYRECYDLKFIAEW